MMRATLDQLVSLTTSGALFDNGIFRTGEPCRNGGAGSEHTAPQNKKCETKGDGRSWPPPVMKMRNPTDSDTIFRSSHAGLGHTDMEWGGGKGCQNKKYETNLSRVELTRNQRFTYRTARVSERPPPEITKRKGDDAFGHPQRLPKQKMRNEPEAARCGVILGRPYDIALFAVEWRDMAPSGDNPAAAGFQPANMQNSVRHGGRSTARIMDSGFAPASR
jgi:hypothetical protein